MQAYDDAPASTIYVEGQRMDKESRKGYTAFPTQKETHIR